jgi:hypothetical protein
VETKFVGLTLKVSKGSFFEEFFIGSLPGFDISLAELEHAIEQAGKFVGSGIDGGGIAEPS